MIKKLIRTFQAFFPGLLEMKFAVQRGLRSFFKRPFEEDFEVLKNFKFSKDESFIDVGANRGQSIDAIRLYYPNASIYAFEPNEILYRKLKDMYKNFNSIKIINSGLSDRSGEFKLYIPVYRKWVFDGLASLDRHSAESWLNNDTLFFFKSSKLRITEMNCSVGVLDSYEFKPGFVKIDVQGLEGSVIRGALETLVKNSPVLLVETESSSAELDLVFPEGYVPCCYKNKCLYIGVRGEQNTIYATRARIESYSGRKDFSSDHPG